MLATLEIAETAHVRSLKRNAIGLAVSLALALAGCGHSDPFPEATKAAKHECAWRTAGELVEPPSYEIGYRCLGGERVERISD